MIKYIIAFAIGGTLFRMGGSDKFGKWVRRWILPFVLVLYNMFKQERKKWWKLISYPLFVIALSMGYGETKPYWEKFLVSCFWVIPKFILSGFYHWQFAAAVPIVFITLFLLSNNKPFSNFFKWPLCEVITGGVIGMAYV